MRTQTRKLGNGFNYQVDVDSCLHCGANVIRDHRDFAKGGADWFHTNGGRRMMLCYYGRPGANGAVTRAAPKNPNACGQ